MKKIILLMLAVLCVASLVLSGCAKQEFEPVTVGEILDLLKAEGYANIQHEEGTSDYILIDSGDSFYEDENDIFISLTTHESDTEHIIQEIGLGCDSFNEEFESLSRHILTYITKDDEFVDEIILSAKIEIAPTKDKRGFSFFGLQMPSDDALKKSREYNPNARRYRMMLTLPE